jgi:hypothetical protein
MKIPILFRTSLHTRSCKVVGVQTLDALRYWLRKAETDLLDGRIGDALFYQRDLCDLNDREKRALWASPYYFLIPDYGKPSKRRGNG